MIQDTDEQIESRNVCTIMQERQINRTVHELMNIYQLYKRGEIMESDVLARYSLQFMNDENISLHTEYTFSISLNREIHRKDRVWDLTDEECTRAFVEHKLRDEINKTYEKYGDLCYLRLKYVY